MSESFYGTYFVITSYSIHYTKLYDFTAAENMPHWGRQLNVINPMSYFIRVIRMVLLKGSGFSDIRHELLAISVYAVCRITSYNVCYTKLLRMRC